MNFATSICTLPIHNSEKKLRCMRKKTLRNNNVSDDNGGLCQEIIKQIQTGNLTLVHIEPDINEHDRSIVSIFLNTHNE